MKCALEIRMRVSYFNGRFKLWLKPPHVITDGYYFSPPSELNRNAPSNMKQISMYQPLRYLGCCFAEVSHSI